MFIDNELNKITLEDGILFAAYNQENMTITLERAKQAVKDRMSVSNGKRLPLVGDISNMGKVDNEAKDYLASEEAMEGIEMLAVIAKNDVQRLIFNFYMRIVKGQKVKSSNGVVIRKIMMRAFMNKSDALYWIKNYNKLN